jgi:uncharacterized protein YjgD (DUF1641 family)
MNDATNASEVNELDRFVEAARDAVTDDMVSRLSGTTAEALDLLDQLNRSGIADALPVLAEMVNNGDLQRIAGLARVYTTAEDAVTDDIVGRLADTAGDGLALLDKVNRAGLDRAVPVLAEMIDNGDLQRVAQLARLVTTAEDAVTDDIVGRLSETIGGGLTLLDQANRSRVGEALPMISEMVENGDLRRVVDMARVLGAAEDALTDDMIGRFAGVMGEAVSVVDRLNRSGVGRLVEVLEKLDSNGGLERIAMGLPKMTEQLELLQDMSGCLTRATEEMQEQPPAKGGLGGILKIVRDRENQEFLRFVMAFGRQMKERCLNRD